MQKTIESKTQTSSTEDFSNRIHIRENIYFTIILLWGLFFYTALLAILGSLFIKGFATTILTSLFYLFTFNLLSLLYLLGNIRGNAVKATEKQFPLVIKILKEQTQQLGIDHLPTVYVLNGHGMIQALALRLFGRDYMVLYSDILSTAMNEESEDVVAFIIGHELAHIQRRHVALWKNLLVLPGILFYPLLQAYSRSCEYTCDAIGHYLSPKGAELGIALLAVGKHLYKKVDLAEYRRTGLENRGLATWWNELWATHPHLIKRLTALQKWNKK